MIAKMLLDNAATNIGLRKTDDLLKVGITYINQVCADLSQLMGETYIPITSLSDRLCLPDSVLDNIAVYGVAMYLALYRGDGQSNQLYATIFNQKRRLLTTSKGRADVLPRGES